MNNPIARQLDQLLQERRGGKLVSDLIAEVLIELALDGDANAIKIILDAVEAYDATLDAAWDQEDDDETS